MILTHFLTLMQSGAGFGNLPSIGAILRPYTSEILMSDDATVVVVGPLVAKYGPALSVEAGITALSVHSD